MDEQTREQRIAAALDREAGQAVPRANLWPAIRQQVQRPPALVGEVVQHSGDVAPPHRSFILQMPVAASAAMLAAVLVLAIAGLNALFPRNVALSPASPATTAPAATLTAAANNVLPPELAARAQSLDLHQTVAGYTVRLLAVYRDEYALLISYALDGPRTRNLSAEGELTDAAGRSISANGWQTFNQVSDGQTVYGLARFSPTAAPARLDLDFRLHLVYNPDIDIHSVSPSLTANLPQAVAGLFSFQFASSLVAERKQAAGMQPTARSGVTVTLQQANFSPSTAQLLLRYDGVAIKSGYVWQPDLQLSSGGLTVTQPATISQRDDGVWVYTMPASQLYAAHDVRLTITALHGYAQSDPNAREIVITDTWPIDFTISPSP